MYSDLISPQIKILKALKEGPKSATELIKETKLPITTLYYNLKTLIIQGLVVKVSRGKYAITERGHEILNKVSIELTTYSKR